MELFLQHLEREVKVTSNIKSGTTVKDRPKNVIKLETVETLSDSTSRMWE